MPNQQVSVPQSAPQWRSFLPFYEYLGLQLEALVDGKCIIRLRCDGTVVRGGRSIGFVEVEVIDEKSHAVSRATITYRILRPRW